MKGFPFTEALAAHILPPQRRFHGSPLRRESQTCAAPLHTLPADRCACCNISVQSVCVCVRACVCVCVRAGASPFPSCSALLCSVLRAVAADVLLHCCSSTCCLQFRGELRLTVVAGGESKKGAHMRQSRFSVLLRTSLIVHESDLKA